ncbi:hypothetical protein GOQ04_14820 [Emticicia sp. ODNR4P]|nr:hypothetical protein [Emticicia sp. ODNR4P]
MATTVGNLPVKGAIKQGGLIGTIDFGTGSNSAPSIWSLALVVQNGTPYLFVKHSADAVANNWRAGHSGLTAGFSDSDLGVLKDIVRLAAKPEATYISNGIVYVTSASDVYYTDGAGNFRSTPYTDASVTDQVSTLLGQIAGNTDTTNTGTTTKKWYQKVWVYFAIGTVATITGILIYKNKKK